MLLRIPTRSLRRLVEDGVASDTTKANTVRAGRKQLTDLDSDALSRKELKALLSYAEGEDSRYTSNLEFLLALRKGAANDKPTDDIENLYEALLQTLQAGKIDMYLYARGDFGALYPYLVTEVRFSRASIRKTYIHQLASITLVLKYSSPSGEVHGESVSIQESVLVDRKIIRDAKEDYQIGYGDIVSRHPKTVAQVLEKEGYYLETPELKATYEHQLDRFLDYVHRYGQQFVGRGNAISVDQDDNWSYDNESSLALRNQDGSNAKLIVDTLPLSSQREEANAQETSNETKYSSWRRRNRKKPPPDLAKFFDANGELIRCEKEDFFQTVDVFLPLWKERELVPAPVHPTLQVFHLESHMTLTVHAVNIKPYKYNPELINSLVLEPQTKEIIHILAMSTFAEEDDVIESKTSGKILLCRGDPGTGKTLTAEVVSELVEKPLYKVQAAQLGTEPDQLEVSLKKHLQRTERWGAIMLIDEANSYIHERGQDKRQNAIVGVFLRLLDYYKGILFLTTNMHGADGKRIDVDDAIRQRCIAEIHYSIPEGKLARKTWQVHSKMASSKDFKVDLSDEQLDDLVSRYKVAGRAIRNMLRLTTTVCKYKEIPFDFEVLERCSKFTPLTANESIQRKIKNG